MPRASQDSCLCRPQEMTAPGLAGPVKASLIESILDSSRPLVPDLPASGKRGSTTPRLSSPNALASKSMTDVITRLLEALNKSIQDFSWSLVPDLPAACPPVCSRQAAGRQETLT